METILGDLSAILGHNFEQQSVYSFNDSMCYSLPNVLLIISNITIFKDFTIFN